MIGIHTKSVIRPIWNADSVAANRAQTPISTAAPAAPAALAMRIDSPFARSHVIGRLLLSRTHGDAVLAAP